jgi:hypothetical protein
LTFLPFDLLIFNLPSLGKSEIDRVNRDCVIHTKKGGLQGHTGHITQIAISHGSQPKIVSASWDCSLRVWDFITGNHLLTYLEHHCRVFSVVISSSDVVISGGQNHQIHLWSLHTGEPFQILFGHTLSILTLSIAHSTPYRPNSSTSITLSSYRGTGSPSSPSSVASTSSDSHSLLASGGEDGKILIWNLSSYDLISSLTHPTRDGVGGPVAVVSVALSKLRGQCTFMVSGGTCGTIALWKLSTQELLHVFDRHFGPISGLVIHEPPVPQYAPVDPWSTRQPDTEEQDPLLVSCSADWTIRIWNLTEKKLIQTLAGHSGGVECLALYTPTPRRTCPTHTPSTTNISPLIISSGRDETIRVWDLKTGTLHRNLEDHSDTVYRVAISSTDTSPMIISGMTTLAVTRGSTSKTAAIVSGGADCCLQLWNLDRIICDLNWSRRKHFGQFIYFIRHQSEREREQGGTGGGVRFFYEGEESNESTSAADGVTLLEEGAGLLSGNLSHALSTATGGGKVVGLYRRRKLSQGETNSFLRACFMDDICYLIAAYL